MGRQTGAWKRTERRVASMLGGQRIPVSGRQRGDQPDIRHDTLSVEVKLRASLPGWLTDAMNQATAARTSWPRPMPPKTAWTQENRKMRLRAPRRTRNLG